MRRRKFLGLWASATIFWPVATRAQKRQAPFPVVGFLDSRSANQATDVAAAFRRGLNEVGYVEGRNVILDYRFADGRYDRLPGLAADLVNSRADVVLAGGPPAVSAAKAAITSIPTVFLSSLDPVKLGLAASLSRPGRNMTGVYLFTSALEPKKLDILRQLAPKAPVIGVLINPKNPNAATVSDDLQTAARTLGVTLLILNASSPDEIDACYETIVQRAVGALLVVTDPFLTGRHNQLVGLAARHSVPTIYALRESVAAGGLVSYGSSILDAYRQAGLYAGKILKGAHPSDLPIMQPTKFELTINLQTAKTLGLTVPLHLQIAADDLID